MSSSKTERQLKELRRLMPWTWDANVEKHPPGQKALKDFENVLSFQDQPRTRKTGSATKTGGPGDSSVNNTSTGRQQPDPMSHGKHAAQPSSERRSHGKRPSPGQPSQGGAAGRGAKVARVEGPHSVGGGDVSVEVTPVAPRHPPDSPTGAASNTNMPSGAAAQTPGTGLLPGASACSVPLSVLASCPYHAALTGAQFRPTPATAAPPPPSSKPPHTAARLPASACKTAGGEHYRTLRRQLLQSSSKQRLAEDGGDGALAGGAAAAAVAVGEESEGAAVAAGGEFRSPLPCPPSAKRHQGVVVTTAISAPFAAPALAPDSVEHSAAVMAVGVPAVQLPGAGTASTAASVGAAVGDLGASTVGAAAVAAAAQVTEDATWQPAAQPAQQAADMEVDGGSSDVAAEQEALAAPGCGGPALPPTPAQPVTTEVEPQVLPATLPAAAAAAAASTLPIPSAAVDRGAGPAAGGGAAAREAPDRGATASHQLMFAGLETATPPQGPLQQPPALPSLMQLQLELQPQAHEAGGAAGQAAPAGTAAEPALLADVAAALSSQLLPGASASAAPAVGLGKPPHHPARASPVREPRRASTGTLPEGAGGSLSMRQGEVLTALSLLPSSGGPHTAGLDTPPAVPLFQAAGGALRRAMSDAGLQTLLRALPKAAVATAVAPSSPGHCPPLFKRRSSGADGAEQRSLASRPATQQHQRQQQVPVGDVEMAEAEGTGAGAALTERNAVEDKGGAASQTRADKENRCGNAAAEAPARPEFPVPLPRAPRSCPVASGPGVSESGARRSLAEQQQQQQLGSCQDAQPAPAPPRPTAAATQPTRPAPALSAAKLRQLSVAGRSQFARERRLLRTLAAKAAPAPAGCAPGGGAGDSSALSMPPPPAFHHLHAHGKHRGGAGAAGGASGRAEGRPPAGGRPGGMGLGHSHASPPSLMSGKRGREAGGALARACALLLKQRLSSKWGQVHVAAGCAQ